MAKMTVEEALRGGKYVLRKKKEQADLTDDQKKPARKLISEGHTLAKGGGLTKKGDRYKDDSPSGGVESDKKGAAFLRKYA